MVHLFLNSISLPDPRFHNFAFVFSNVTLEKVQLFIYKLRLFFFCI